MAKLKTDAKRTITLDGNNQIVHEEGVLDTAAFPGMNIVLASDGNFDPGAGVASATLPRIVKEDVLSKGRTVDDEIAIGDIVPMGIPTRGAKMQVLVLSGEDVDKGELLVADSAGKFVTTAAAPAQFEASESSSGALATDVLIEAVAL